MANAYLLWFHQEDGPERLKITLDRSKIPAMVEGYRIATVGPIQFDWFEKAGCPNLPQDVKAILDSYTDEDFIRKFGDGMNLTGGWDGLHLQICPLE